MTSGFLIGVEKGRKDVNVQELIVALFQPILINLDVVNDPAPIGQFAYMESYKLAFGAQHAMTPSRLHEAYKSLGGSVQSNASLQNVPAIGRGSSRQAIAICNVLERPGVHR